MSNLFYTIKRVKNLYLSHLADNICNNIDDYSKAQCEQIKILSL